MGKDSFGELEGDPGPYGLARGLWEYLLTDDNACRDICDRDGYIAREITSNYPNVHPKELNYISQLALNSVIDKFHL